MNKIEAVSLDHAKELADRLINCRPVSLTALGPVTDADFKGLL
jgi:hypothetical protein